MYPQRLTRGGCSSHKPPRFIEGLCPYLMSQLRWDGSFGKPLQGRVIRYSLEAKHPSELWRMLQRLHYSTICSAKLYLHGHQDEQLGLGELLGTKLAGIIRQSSARCPQCKGSHDGSHIIPTIKRNSEQRGRSQQTGSFGPSPSTLYWLLYLAPDHVLPFLAFYCHFPLLLG